jgi:site-specific recombinase XerD
MKNYDFAYYLTNFLSTHLPGYKKASKNTVYSYRDAFSKLLAFFSEELRITPDKLRLKHFSRAVVEDFLMWLENKHGCSVSTTNQRLAAIRSFFIYIQAEAPEHLLLCQTILEVHQRKHEKPVIQYLTYDSIKLLLEQPDASTWNGRRDLVILSVLYDSAVRAQEICDLTMRSLRTDAPATLRIKGKGGKSRYVSLSSPTAKMLRQYIAERGLDVPEKIDSPLFANRQGGKLTRGGLAYILKKYVDKANDKKPYSIPEQLTPHCLRHSKAMHLLESGVNLIYIRDFLGHEDVETTQVYAKANPEVKRVVMENLYTDETAPQLPSWNTDPHLMQFLRQLRE